MLSKRRKPLKVSATRSVPGLELRFSDGADLIGHAEHRGATRENFITQKNIAGALALRGVPLENRISSFQ